MDLSGYERVVRKFCPECSLVRAWELRGGVSAHVVALEVEGAGGQTRKMVIRRHGASDLSRNPHIAADEFNLLRLLHGDGLAVPEPFYLDESGEVFPTPYIAVEFIEGETQFQPAHLPDYIIQFTCHLTTIHGIDIKKAHGVLLPQQSDVYNARLRKRVEDIGLVFGDPVQDALQAVWPLPARNRPVLLHGDYWPGNILWRDRALVGIVDWEDAAIGDPLADVANSRLEILWAFGVEAMEAFTDQYRAMSGLDFTDLPYWDLGATLRPAGKFTGWATDETAAGRMEERFAWFIDNALREIRHR